MTGYKTQCGHGEFNLQFKTDRKNLYTMIEATARECMDLAAADVVLLKDQEGIAEAIQYWKSFQAEIPDVFGKRYTEDRIKQEQAVRLCLVALESLNAHMERAAPAESPWAAPAKEASNAVALERL